MSAHRDFNPAVRRVASARARCDQLGATIVELQEELVGAEREWQEACAALDRAIAEEGHRAALPPLPVEAPRTPRSMPERVLAVLERHPGETLSTATIAAEAGGAKEDLVYQALRRMVLKRRRKLTQPGPGLWRYARTAPEEGDSPASGKGLQ